MYVTDLFLSLPPSLEYVDFMTVARDLSAELRDPKGPYAVDLVIALTHSRLPNDIILAKECRDEIDLVLGGYVIQRRNASLSPCYTN
jgi:hypothetical protein